VTFPSSTNDTFDCIEIVPKLNIRRFRQQFQHSQLNVGIPRGLG